MLELLLELIGTVAFSVSGAVVGIQKKMDMLGVVTLGIMTAVGGGIIRDLLIGVTPPMAFKNPIFIVISIITALIVFLPVVSKAINLDRFIWILADSVGLGAFTVIGVLAGVAYDNIFLEVFLGVTTGVGGGVIRDICAGGIPMIFVKHFYACACIIGAIVCAIFYDYNPIIAVVLSFSVTVILRLLEAKFKWHLPKAK